MSGRYENHDALNMMRSNHVVLVCFGDLGSVSNHLSSRPWIVLDLTLALHQLSSIRNSGIPATVPEVTLILRDHPRHLLVSTQHLSQSAISRITQCEMTRERTLEGASGLISY